MPATTYAQTRMAELLSAATTALSQANTGNAPPATAIRTHGAPVVPTTRCGELLAVYLGNPAVKLSAVAQTQALQAGPKRIMALLQLYVELWRCTPGLDAFGGEPTTTALDTSAAALAADMWALWTVLKQDIDAGSLFPAGFAPQFAKLGDPVPLGPLGRMGGWRILVEAPTSDIGPP